MQPNRAPQPLEPYGRPYRPLPRTMTSGTSNSAARDPTAPASERRKLYLHIIDVEHQMDLTIKDVSFYRRRLTEWIESPASRALIPPPPAPQVPPELKDYRDCIQEVHTKRYEPISWALSDAKVRLEQLVSMGLVKQSLLSPKKYLPKTFEAHIAELERKFKALEDAMVELHWLWNSAFGGFGVGIGIEVCSLDRA